MEQSPMIDFERVQEIIPEGGSLSLIFKKTGDRIIVCYDPKHKIKTGEEKFLQPITMSGTAAELNEGFEDGIISISKKEKTLAEVLNEKAGALDKKIEEAKNKKNPAKSAPPAPKSKGPVKKEKEAPEPAKEEAPEKEETAVSTATPTGGNDLFGASSKVPGSFDLDSTKKETEEQV